MASILDKYGIKEVADVTFYEIDSEGKPGKPVLYLDTLKVSTIEQTAEVVYAQGGKGNANLVAWDYGKEITVTLEDALFSAKSMAVMLGDGNVKTGATLIKTITFTGKTVPAHWQDASGTYQTVSTGSLYKEDGTTVTAGELTEGGIYYYKFNYVPTTTNIIEVSADKYPGTYYVTGDTYARSEKTGKDEYFQFIIPKAKMSAENTITLEAEGDPSVFSMNLSVLRPEDGIMLKLVKYDLGVGTTLT